MTPREQVLANVRRSLGVTGEERPRRKVVEDRLGAHPSGVIPDRAAGRSRVEQLRLFVALAGEAAATVAVVRSADDAPAEIAAWLRGHGEGLRLRRGGDPRLQDLPWEKAGLAVETGRSFGDDRTTVSAALGGVAETGTLVMVSGLDNPTTLNFLPDNHVVILDAADVAATYEDLWARIRTRYGEAAMPRTVNWITGPSRSADIEQTLLMGAHGPKRLHIVLIDREGEISATDETEAMSARPDGGGEKNGDAKPAEPDKPAKPKESERPAQPSEEEYDEEVEESFPASDPPSRTQP